MSQGAKLFNGELILFLVAMILANLGGSMFYPFFAIYLSKLGLDVGAIGIFFTLLALFPLLFQIFGGWVSDRVGRLKSIALGSVAGAVSWVGMVIAPLTPIPIALFLVSNAIGSITVALVAPSFDAFIAERSKEGNRAKVFALVQSLFLVVGILGPPLGGLISQHYSFQILAWTSAILYWSATVIRVGMARRIGAAPRASSPPQPEASTAPAPLGFVQGLKALAALAVGGGIFLWVFVVDGTLDIANKLDGDLLPLFLQKEGGLSPSAIGFLQGFSSLVCALAMVPLGSLADKRGERLPLILGCVLPAMASFLLWKAPSLGWYGLAFLLFGLGSAAFQPAMQAITARAVPEPLRGLAYGFLGSSIGVFSFAAPALGAWLWKAFFPALPFLASGLILLGGGLLCGLFLGPERRPQGPTSEAKPGPT